MKNNKERNPKANLIWGIILTIIFLLSLIGFIISLVHYLAMPDSFEAHNFSILPGILFFLALGTSIGAHFLLANYEKPDGKKGALCMIFYIISSLIFWLICGIALLGIKIYRYIDSSSPSTPKPKTFSDLKEEDYENYTPIIQGKYGDVKLHWDKYTRNWRDSEGHQFVTKDGKTFIQIK